VVGAAGADELHASLDTCHGVDALHSFEFSLFLRKR
jgi:hypothetical protein